MGYLSIIANLLKGKRVAILGYGREGRSTCRFLLKHFPEFPFAVIDKDDGVACDDFLRNFPRVRVFCGSNYLEALEEFNFVIKSPGISQRDVAPYMSGKQLSSQADIFLACFASQVIGITGTKGKSTTSSLLTAIFKEAGRDTVFVGNIGLPPFDKIEDVEKQTLVVYEMSSHQLDGIAHSPHVAILLNIYQEHLDHYDSYEAYQDAKFNIALHQKSSDYFIYNADSEVIAKKLNSLKASGTRFPFSISGKDNTACFVENENICIKVADSLYTYQIGFERYLKGSHNFSNILAVIGVAKIMGIKDVSIFQSIARFRGLEHRLEYVGRYGDKDFYNDSIATIPEATIAALETLSGVDTLILGGFDRGIDYDTLATYLTDSEVRHIVLLGSAGERIYKLVSNTVNKNIYYYRNFDDGVLKAIEITAPKKTCLLSPAAASYGMFKDFEERGNRFKALVQDK